MALWASQDLTQQLHLPLLQKGRGRCALAAPQDFLVAHSGYVGVSYANDIPDATVLEPVEHSLLRFREAYSAKRVHKLRFDQ